MKTKTDMEIYFTPKQAAECFNLSLSTIKNYIYAGKLKTLVTPGGHHRIRKSDVLCVLEERLGQTAAYTENHSDEILQSCCYSLLNTFKLLGLSGNSFIIHAKRVSEFSYDLAKAIGLKEQESKLIALAALVHDIGIMGIERRIILKAGILTPQEYELLKNHPSLGKELLASVKELKDIGDIVYQHHERIDGTGYPRGLSGDSILKGARIISITEAYDAMVSEYSYKNPVSVDTAIAELMQHKGTQFDANMVEVFTKIL